MLQLATLILAGAVPSTPDVAIVGATITDVGHRKGPPRDRENATILIRGDRIHAIVPGLIDGYGAMRRQSFANAYLYEGVTTVVVPLAPTDGGEGEDRVVVPAAGPDVLAAAPIAGHSLTGSIPPPDDRRRQEFEGRPLRPVDLKAAIARMRQSGVRAPWAAPDIAPGQLRTLVAAAHRHGMPVVAEMASSTYRDGPCAA